MQTIVSDLSRCLDAWPSDRQFTVEQVLSDHPEFGEDSMTMEQLVLEEYVRRLESGRTA